MATVANLVVKLSANTTNFSKGMKKGRRELGGFSSKASQAKAVFTKAAAGIAAAAALAAVAITRMALKQIEALDKTIKFAERIGVATGELQKLQFAAELSGVGADTLNMALQRMTRRIAEAAAGTGEAKSALEELGVDAVRLSAIGPEKAFAEIADAMQMVESQSDKVRLAFKLFDSEGVALVNTLSLGSQGLREAGDEAERLGLAISEFDSRQIEEANDSITRMGKAWEGIKNAITVLVAPAIDFVAGVITNMSQGLLTTIRDMKALFGVVDTSFTEAAIRASQQSDKIAKAQEKAKKVIEQTAAATKKLNDEKERLAKVESFKRLGESITKALRKPAEVLKDELAELRTLVFQGFIDPDTFRRAADKAKKDFEEATKPDKPEAIKSFEPARAAALQRGSAQAFAAIAEAARRPDVLSRTLKEQVVQQKQTRQVLEQIEENTSDLVFGPARL